MILGSTTSHLSANDESTSKTRTRVAAILANPRVSLFSNILIVVGANVFIAFLQTFFMSGFSFSTKHCSAMNQPTTFPLAIRYCTSFYSGCFPCHHQCLSLTILRYIKEMIEHHIKEVVRGRGCVTTFLIPQYFL